MRKRDIRRVRDQKNVILCARFFLSDPKQDQGYQVLYGD